MENMEKLKPLHPNKVEPITSFREQSELTERELFIKILETGGISRMGENITLNDLFSIPREFTKEDILNVAAMALEIKPEELEQNMDKISECFRDAKVFMNEYLLQDFPKSIQKIEGFKNSDDLFNLLKKTKTLKKTGGSIGLSPAACAVTLITIAEWEYRKGNFEGLKNESEYIYKKLFEEDESGTTRFHETRKKKDKDWSEVGILTDESGWVDASFSYRGKGKDSTINKILQKPELTSKEVITDGIGLRFEVKTKEDAQKLITFLAKNLQEKFEMNKLLFSNVGGLIDEEEIENLKELLKNKNIFSVNKNNPSSHESFQALKLDGEIKVPENGEEGRIIIGRSFEIQIVLTDNNNETGLAQHSIYKRAQKLSSYTRLYGSFSEDYLDLICKEASNASGLGAEGIKKYFVKRFLTGLENSKTKKIKPASKDQIERWDKAGFLPKDIINTKKPPKLAEEVK